MEKRSMNKKIALVVLSLSMLTSNQQARAGLIHTCLTVSVIAVGTIFIYKRLSDENRRQVDEQVDTIVHKAQEYGKSGYAWLSEKIKQEKNKGSEK